MPVTVLDARTQWETLPKKKKKKPLEIRIPIHSRGRQTVKNISKKIHNKASDTCWRKKKTPAKDKYTIWRRCSSFGKDGGLGRSKWEGNIGAGLEDRMGWGATCISGGRTFQAEKTACAKVLRQKHAWCVLGIAKIPMWLKQSRWRDTMTEDAEPCKSDWDGKPWNDSEQSDTKWLVLVAFYCQIVFYYPRALFHGIRLVFWRKIPLFCVFFKFLLFIYLFSFWPCSMWDPSSPTRDQTRAPAVEAQSLNYWTAREVPHPTFFLIEIQLPYNIV